MARFERRDRRGRFNPRGRFVAREGMLVRIETILRPLPPRRVKEITERLRQEAEEAIEAGEKMETSEFGGAFDSP
ncbi:MAG: hypothetical protein MN733_07290 [Nitrososphaera sp.]|nr:hypothetical protein [Nitrososphaera sp.]